MSQRSIAPCRNYDLLMTSSDFSLFTFVCSYPHLRQLHKTGTHHDEFAIVYSNMDTILYLFSFTRRKYTSSHRTLSVFWTFRPATCRSCNVGTYRAPDAR